MPVQLAVWFDPITDIDDAIDQLMQIKRLRQDPAGGGDERDDVEVEGGDSDLAPSSAAGSDAVTLYDHTDPATLSRKFYAALGTEGQTLADLAHVKILRNADGSELSTASMRAVFRNLRRTEGRLLAEGAISAQVVQTNFDNYDRDGGARYFLKPDAMRALDQRLGR